MVRRGHYLQYRDGYWRYIRRVPLRYAAVDDRGVIRVLLKTRSEETARLRRDALIEADDLYWASLINHNDAAASVRPPLNAEFIRVIRERFRTLNKTA